MNLSPRQLRVFTALANALSFSRAAEQLCMTQPALSKLIRSLEAAVGAPLFLRNTRMVQLTAQGEAMLPVAHRMVQDYERGMLELNDLARYAQRRVSVVALPTLAATFLPDIVAEVRRHQPDAFIKVHEEFADDAMALVRSRKVDLALIDVDRVDPDLRYQELLREPFVLLASRLHQGLLPALAWNAVMRQSLPFISMPKGSGTRRYIDLAYARTQEVFRPSMELRNLATIGRFVASGCGIALLPRSGAELAMGEGLYIHPMAGAPVRSIGLLYRQDAALSPLALQLIEAIGRHAHAIQASARPAGSKGRE